MSRPRPVVTVCLAAVALVVLVGLLVACGDSGPDGSGSGSTGPPDKVSLQLNWFHEAEFVGYYLADAKGFYDESGLIVEIREGGPDAPGGSAIHHVTEGTADFAISSFGEQRDALADKGPTIAVLSAFQIPPLVIFSLAESGVATPSDLAGKRVGVTTDYWKGVLEETLQAAGVDPSEVAQVDTQAEDLQELYDGEVDAWLGYAQDEPIHAEVAGHDVKAIFPADYGIGGYEGLLLVHERTLAEKADLVRRFVQASQRGWQYAVEHPDEAAQVLLEWAPEPGLEFQQLAVRAVGPLVDVPQWPIGWIDAERWRRLMGSSYDPDRPGYTMSFSASRP